MVNQRLLSQSKTMKIRKMESNLKKALFQREILVLIGARQVGKTSLLLRLILYLIGEEHISANQIVYFDLEFPHILKQINNLYGDDFLYFLRAQGVETENPAFVFIDEIHYLDNPSSFLKVLYDHYPQLKLIVSGYSSLQIRQKFKETLTGRKRVFEIFPLDFEEFLEFKGSSLSQRKKELTLSLVLKNRSLPDLSELRYLINDFTTYWDEFIIFGGYPRVVLTDAREDKIAQLAEIHSSYIRQDIKDFARIENPKAFNNLVDLLSHQIANLVNISEITNSLNISRPTVENYLFLLENTFIISLLSPYYTNRRQEIIKSCKVFFYDTGLRNSLMRNFDPLSERIDKGIVFENAVFSELSNHLDILEELRFWRTKSKAEVDFVIRDKDVIPIEVKYRSFKTPEIPTGLRSFIKTYSPPAAIVTTRDSFVKESIEGTPTFFLPAWVL